MSTAESGTYIAVILFVTFVAVDGGVVACKTMIYVPAFEFEPRQVEANVVNVSGSRRMTPEPLQHMPKYGSEMNPAGKCIFFNPEQL